MTSPVKPIIALLFGHSHATCMVAAMRQKLFPAVSDDIAFRVVGYGSKAFPGGLVVGDSNRAPVASPVVLAAIDRAAAEAEAKGRQLWLVSVVGGNAANRLAIFNSGPAVDFILPGDASPPVADAERFIPYDAVERAMERQLAVFDQFLKLLPRQRVAGIAHLEGPSPCMDNEFVVSSLPAAARQLVQASGTCELTAELVAPPAYRRRLWLCQAAVTRRIVESHGALYVTPPPEALDADGHRRLDTCSDACHGTPAYGAMALAHLRRSILAHVQGSRAT